MTEIERKKLNEITFQDKNILIIGLIIGKTDPHIFISKRTEELCGVLTLTIRDSPNDFTNLKIWAKKETIDEINEKFHLFDIIDVINPKIFRLSNTNQIEFQQFEPTVPIQYRLIITEENGSIEPHFSWNENEKINIIQRLQNEILKPVTTILNLIDIYSSGSEFTGQFVDLFVNVRFIKSIRQIKSKTGSMLKCLELIVIDKSLLTGISFTIWNNEWIRRITSFWKPLETILHLIDVRVGFFTYYKMAVLGMSARTIIIENPNIKETYQLRNFISNSQLPDSEILKFGSFNLPNAESITTIMTVKQIYDRIDGHLKEETSDQFTAVLYAMLTKFDIDGYSNIIGKKCKCCKKRLKKSDLLCFDDRCQMQFSFEYSGDKFDQFFDINIHLTDHTGTLLETRLSDKIAEEILNINVEDFLKLESNEITKLKWKFLFNRFEAKLLIRKKSFHRNNNYIILISLNDISLDDVANKILIY